MRRRCQYFDSVSQRMIAIRYLESYLDAIGPRGPRDESAEAYIKDARAQLEREQRRQKKNPVPHRRRRDRHEIARLALRGTLRAGVSFCGGGAKTENRRSIIRSGSETGSPDGFDSGGIA